MKHTIDVLVRKIAQRQELIVLLLLIIALLPYLFVSIYSNPIADDFTYAFKGKTENLFDVLLGEYLGWNGRYISNIFVLLNPIVFDSFIGYKTVPILLILFLYFAIFFLISCIFNGSVKNMQKWIISLVVLILYLYQMPNISEGIYWYTGAVTYSLGSIFFLVYASLIILFLQNRFVLNNRLIHIVFLVLINGITVGFNEIIMLAMLLFSFTVWLTLKLNNRGNHKQLFFLLISTFLFAAVVFFAPGNMVRETHFTANHRFFNSLLLSSVQTIRFSLQWISSLPLLVLSVLYFRLNKKLAAQIDLFKQSFYLTPVGSLSLIVVSIFIGAFPAYWATGILGQHRTINVSYLLFLLLWFINLTVVYNRFSFWNVVEIKYHKPILYLLVFLSLIFTKNGYNLIYDLKTSNCSNFDLQMNERYSIIENNMDTVYFEPIQNKPHTLFVLDITDNPESWQNKGYAIFFNKPDLKVMLK